MKAPAPSNIPVIDVPVRLRLAREHAGMDQSTLAEKVGAARRTISAAENGGHKPRRSLLILWSMATGVPLEWILTGQEKTPGPDGPGESVARPEGFEPPTF
ncbi:helix-turn-helix transcriptional regulator [Dermabacteraceae bacterium CCM 9519]